MADYTFTAPNAKHVRRLHAQHLASEGGEVDWDAISMYVRLPVETCKYIIDPGLVGEKSPTKKGKPKAEVLE